MDTHIALFEFFYFVIERYAEDGLGELAANTYCATLRAYGKPRTEPADGVAQIRFELANNELLEGLPRGIRINGVDNRCIRRCVHHQRFSASEGSRSAPKA